MQPPPPVSPPPPGQETPPEPGLGLITGPSKLQGSWFSLPQSKPPLEVLFCLDELIIELYLSW